MIQADSRYGVLPRQVSAQSLFVATSLSFGSKAFDFGVRSGGTRFHTYRVGIHSSTAAIGCAWNATAIECGCLSVRIRLVQVPFVTAPANGLRLRKARSYSGLSFLNCNAVVIVHRTSPGRVAPVPGVVVSVFRRSLELFLGDAGTIAAEFRVVF